MTIEKGKIWGYTVVFEIPKESVGKLDASIHYSYTTINNAPSLNYDKDLVLPDPPEPDPPEPEPTTRD